MTTAVGTKVMAIRDVSKDDKIVNLFGMGVYVGDEVPPGREDEIRAWVALSRDIDREVLDEDEGEALEKQHSFNRAAISIGSDGYSEEELAGFVQKSRAEAERKLALSEEEYCDWLRTQPMFTNPRIDLDGGGTVWGYQCWWGAEERLQVYVDDGYEIVNVPLPEAS